MQVYLVIFMNCSRKNAEQSELCVLPTVIPTGSSIKDKNSSKRTLPCYKKNHHNQELTWWESIKLLESTHLTDLKVT